jgi:hypothetical protein
MLWHLEAVTGVEPAYLVLQTNARPLGYTANLICKSLFSLIGDFLEEAEKRQNPANQAYADLQLQQEVFRMIDLKFVSIKMRLLYNIRLMFCKSIVKCTESVLFYLESV